MTAPALKTKIFLDSGNPEETKSIHQMLGFLDGQTTNPSLVAKYLSNSQAQKMSEIELLANYQEIINKIANVIPNGAISIEVYADKNTHADEMLRQANLMYDWCENAYIKLPITQQGLQAAAAATKKNIRVNMTLCFSQQQAAAVYAATRGSIKEGVFVSPFIGRLDDKNIDGMDLIRNIKQMYAPSDRHVQLLAASIRSIEHFLYCLYLEADIITAPFNILEEWHKLGMPIPSKNDPDYSDQKKYLNSSNKSSIEYTPLNLELNWDQFNIEHELSETGLEKFAADWKALISS